MPRKVKLHPGQVALLENLANHKADVKVLRTLQAQEQTAVVPPHYIRVSDPGQLREIAQELALVKLCAFDVETNGLGWAQPGFFVAATGIHVSGQSFFIPNNMTYALRNFDRGEMQDYLGAVLEDPSIHKITHSGKFDIHCMRQCYGIDMCNPGHYHDVALAGWLLDENDDHSLEDLCVKYLDDSPKWKVKQDGSFGVWPMKMAQLYLGHDVEMTMKLFEFQVPYLEQMPELHDLMYDVEMPHSLILGRAEARGFGFDVEYFKTVAQEEVNRLVKFYEGQVHDILGPINLSSPEQVSAALFDGLKLPRINENHTDKRVMSKLRGMHPVVEPFMQFKKYSQIKKMSIDTLLDWVVDGYIFTDMRPIGTVTGRLACVRPNLQQLPKRSVGPIVRRAFVPRPGYALLAFDYSQFELRILAHLANDETLIADFESGMDLHTVTANRLFGIPIADLEANKDMPERITAKNVNFGIPYGIGDDKLTDQINMQLPADAVKMTKAQSKQAINDWMAARPASAAFIHNQAQLAHRDGFVTTILGRKRRLYDEIDSDNWGVVGHAERSATNSPIQGSVADFIKTATIAVDAKIREEHWPYQFLLQVHDELIFEVPKDWLAKHKGTVDEIRHIMENVIKLRCPVVVNVEILSRWGDKLPEDYLEVDEAA